jgi:hypothetical protein
MPFASACSRRIGFAHPVSGAELVIEAPLAADLAAFVARLNAARRNLPDVAAG